MDIVYAIDATPIRSADDFRWAVIAMHVGKPCVFHVERFSSEIGRKPTWEKLTFTVVPLPRREVAETVQNSSASDLDLARTQWEDWEKSQSQVEQLSRAFEMKGDRLGMTLAMFKGKHRRVVPGDPRPAPFCSDADPDRDNPSLLYRRELSRAGIVHVRTTLPVEEQPRFHDGEYLKPEFPTIAGVRTELYVYHFVDGRLYRMTIFFPHTGFDNVLDALKAKFGQPKGKEIRKYENAFGVKLEGDVLLWHNSVSEMVLFERAGTTDRSLLILTQKELERTAYDHIKSKIKPRTDDL